MSTATIPFHTRGWCPGALAPMASGDGLLVRLRATLGRLSPEQAHAVADLSRRLGNGLIDLSQRANLQIRGLSAHDLPELHFALRAHWLLDSDSAAEAIRNVVAPPLAGLDPAAAIDGACLAGTLERALLTETDLQALPGKFGFSVDDGGQIGLEGLSVDIRLIGWQGRVLLALAGPASHAALVEIDQAVPAALALARAFLRLAPEITPPARRMAALVQAVGAEALFAAAGLDRLFAVAELPHRRTRADGLIGAFPSFVGVALPFGRLSAYQLDLLAEAAMIDLRLTPWRVILLPGASAEDLARLGASGLITRSDDPRLGIVACPGRPYCASAEVETRGAAERLARTVSPRGPVPWLHLSGCGKGCASHADHPVTLVGRRDRFDLIAGGRPGGKVLRHDLTLAEVEDALSSGILDP